MGITITEATFLEVVNSGKRKPEVIHTPNQQLLVQWRVLDKGEETPLVVRVYSSIFGDPGYGVNRDTGKDSIRVALVDDVRNVGIGKATWTQRTEGWDDRLKDKVRQVFQQAVDELVWRKGREIPKSFEESPIKGRVADSPCCPKCDSSMKMRTAKKGFNKGGKFWGCSKYPKCKGTLKEGDYVPMEEVQKTIEQLAAGNFIEPYTEREPKAQAKPKSFKELVAVRKSEADWAL